MSHLPTPAASVPPNASTYRHSPSAHSSGEKRTPGLSHTTLPPPSRGYAGRAGCTRGRRRPRLRPAHGRLPARVRGRQAVVEDLDVRPPDGGQAAADDARPRPPEHAAPAAVHARRARTKIPSASCSLRAPICRHSVCAPGHNIAVLLDCSKSSRQCSLSYLLTYFR